MVASCRWRTVGADRGLSGVAILGTLTASVTIDGQASGTAVQVATVVPAVTTITTGLGINQTTLTIQGGNFTLATGNIVKFSNGVTGKVSGTPTSLLRQLRT